MGNNCNSYDDCIKGLNLCYYNEKNTENDNIINNILINNESKEKENFFKNSSKENKIKIIYKVNKPKEKIRLFGLKFVEKNKNNCKMCIDFEELEISEFYETKQNQGNELTVILDINNKITDLSYMFCGCSSLKKLPNFHQFKFENITSISNMFYGCSSLTSLPNEISDWNTTKVIDMSYLFSEMPLLKSLPNISKWNTSNVINMKSMFSFSSSLKSITDLSEWKTDKVTDISGLFYGCSSLIKLPDINKWNTNNITDFSYIFGKCSSLESLPDISKWNTNKVKDMSYMFYKCSSLKSMPDISNWITDNVTDMSYMFYGCSSLKYFPFISKWNTQNVLNMSHMFCGCSSLISIDNNISNWNTVKVTDISMIFSDCISLESYPDISHWKICQENLDINENNTDKDKYEVRGLIKDDNLKFIPQVKLKFNEVDEVNEDIINRLKNEIKELIGSENFSIIDIRKGSLSIILTLQCIFMKVLKNIKNDKFMDLGTPFLNSIKNEVENITSKLREKKFISLGTIKPDFVNEDILDITNENNREEISKEILKMSKETVKDDNIMEAAKNIKIEDFFKYIRALSSKSVTQENNCKEIIKNLEEHNKLFDEEIEKALNNSIFEYKIIHVFMVYKDDKQYLKEKIKCYNVITKILFHGTKVNNALSILSNKFNNARVHIFGIGTYFTDVLDYAWFYAGENYRGNFYIIPKVGDSFSIVASEIYYDSSKLEKVYNCQTRDVEVPKNGIRCAYANYDSCIMTEEILKEYKGFVGNEFVITDKDQILPLYVVTMKRVEYLIIWRDYNFDPNNPNNYDEVLFNKIQEFHRKIKIFTNRELDSKLYGITNTEEALELLERKKYNKVIIITNGNNEGQDFLLKARRIIGANTIAAVSVYNVSGHIQWVKNMENVLILNDVDFHEKFFNCVKMKSVDLYDELRKEIIDYYKKEIIDFDLSENTPDLFNFPNFKNEGKFEDLEFDFNKNEADIGYNPQIINTNLNNDENHDDSSNKENEFDDNLGF